MGIYIPPKLTKVTGYAKSIIQAKQTKEFDYLLKHNVNEIILFEDTKEEEDYTDKIVLPRHYIIFVGNKDNELQFKPYEYNQYRIVVSTYKDIITDIISIG
jgi:hypothetical protein